VCGTQSHSGHFRFWIFDFRFATGNSMTCFDRCRVIAQSSLLIAMALLFAESPLAAADELVPDDTCYVDLEMPPDATVTVDGRPRGQKRELSYSSLRPGTIYRSRITVRMADGNQQQHELLVRGGRRMRLAVSPSADSRPRMMLQAGHTQGISCLAISPDQQLLLTGSADNTVGVWNTDTGHMIHAFNGHKSEIQSLAFTADGRHAVSASSFGQTLVWNVLTGKVVRTLDRQTSPMVYDTALTPDGNLLVGSHPPNVTLEEFKRTKGRITEWHVSVWNARTGEKLRTLKGGPKGEPTCIAVTANGKWIATGTREGDVTLWDGRTTRAPRSLPNHQSEVGQIVFSPDGSQLITICDDSATVWDAASARKLDTFQHGQKYGVSAAMNSAGDKLVICGGSNVSIWDLATRQMIESWRVLHSVQCAKWDEGMILLGHSDGSVSRWLGESAKALTMYGGKSRTRIMALDASPIEGLIAVARENGAVTLWDLDLGKPRHVLRGHFSKASAVAFSPDGSRLVTGSWDKRALVCDVETGTTLHQLTGHTDCIESVAYSPTGEFVATGTRNRELFLWNADTGRKEKALSKADEWTKALAFSADGRRLAANLNPENAIRVWDALSGKVLRTLKIKEVFPRELREQIIPEAMAQSIEFSQDDQFLHLGVNMGSGLYDANSGHLIRGVSEIGGGLCAKLSHDGRLAVFAESNSHTIVVWDTQNERLLRRFRGHSAEITGLDFTFDSERVVSASADGSVRIWDVGTGVELARLMSMLSLDDWLVTTPDGLFDGSESARQRISYRVGNGLDVVPVDRFFQDFYRPGLLSTIWNGSRPIPEVELGQSKPPTLLITSPTDSIVDADQVTVEVEATDAGGGIQGPWLRHNGARIAAAGEARREGERQFHTFHVRLVEGENRLRVEAASADGSWESEPARLNLAYAKELARPELYVLSVGVNKYADAALNLSFAARDAEQMATLFERRGGKLYQAVHVRRLLDDAATKSGIREALTTIAGQARPQDALLVFLSGHGLAIGQRYYFIPHDLNSESARFEDDVRRAGLPIDELADGLGAVPALKRMLVLDTCNSGAAIGRSGGQGKNPFAFRGAVERLSRAQGIFTIAASASSESTVEVPALGHGVLTYSLLAGMKAVDAGPLADKWVHTEGTEPVVGVLDWFNFASGQVPRLTQQFTGQAQDVKMSGEGTSFPVLPLEE
jgi:WD40 repeat protein